MGYDYIDAILSFKIIFTITINGTLPIFTIYRVNIYKIKKNIYIYIYSIFSTIFNLSKMADFGHVHYSSSPNFDQWKIV